jgi:hypothetical protein
MTDLDRKQTQPTSVKGLSTKLFKEASAIGGVKTAATDEAVGAASTSLGLHENPTKIRSKILGQLILS